MQEAQVVVAGDKMTGAARSHIYRLLGQAFFYPGTQSSAEFLAPRLGELRRVLPLIEGHGIADAFLADLSTLESLVGRDADQPMSDAYTALFDNCTGRATVSLYEKDYGNGDAKMIWEEAIRFYEHFGLEFDVRVTRDWPDHIGTELEFMHYLTYLEAATEGGVEAYRQAQGDFLVRRLARWAHRFCAQVERRGAASPYLPLARMLMTYIEAEVAFLGRTAEPLAQWVPQNEAQSGMPSGNAWIPIVEASALEAFD